MKKKSTIIVIIIAVLLIGAAAWLVASGKLTVTWNGFGATSRANVCNAAFIEDYNKASNYEYRDGPDQRPRVDTEGLKEIANRIKATDGYNLDPTCQVMLFWIAAGEKDANAAKSALTAIKDLNQKQAYPNNNLRTSVALSEYDAALEYVVNPPQTPTGIVTE